MTNMRLLALVLAVSPAFAGATACGGESSVDADPTVPDSGSDIDESDSGSDSGNLPPPFEAKIAPVAPVYVGHVVALDGSGSTGPTGLTYQWAITKAPEGSSTASLTEETTAKPTLVPDIPGEYELTLTITAGDAVSTTRAKAIVVDPPVFYIKSSSADGSTTASLNVIGATAGTKGSEVACGEVHEFAPRAAARGGVDWWEAPAGKPSRVAFVVDTGEDGDERTILAATTSEGTCATPPQKLDGMPEAFGSKRTLEEPRFSPNGERIAYLRNSPDGARLATVGFDGSGLRMVAPYAALPGGGPDPAGPIPADLSAVRPVWIDDTTVAWFQRTNPDVDGWQIVQAPDKANATPTLVMRCGFTLPSQFAILPSGEVLVSELAPIQGPIACPPDEPCPTHSRRLVAYPIDPETKACGEPRALVEGATPGFEFALSPDKSHVAFRVDVSIPQRVFIGIAPVGKAEPLVPAHYFPESAGATRGPRWVGGGAFLAFGIGATMLDAGTGNAVAVVNAKGTSFRAAVVPEPGESVEPIGHGCTFAPALGSGVSLFGAVGLAGLRWVRRRRSPRGVAK